MAQFRHAGPTKLPSTGFLQSLAAPLVVGALLFGSAGTLGLPAFWGYVGLMAIVSAVGFFAIDPELRRERMRPGGRPLATRYLLIGLLPLAHLVLAGLDRGRLRWAEPVPVALQIAGFLLLGLGWAVILWALHVNRFFSSVIRIQRERGHHVVTHGPYRFVRHPGYAAAILLILASGLALGSWLAAGAAAFGIPLILWRCIAEDRILLEELPGYRDYARAVPYRLVPGVW